MDDPGVGFTAKPSAIPPVWPGRFLSYLSGDEVGISGGGVTGSLMTRSSASRTMNPLRSAAGLSLSLLHGTSSVPHRGGMWARLADDPTAAPRSRAGRGEVCVPSMGPEQHSRGTDDRRSPADVRGPESQRSGIAWRGVVGARVDRGVQIVRSRVDGRSVVVVRVGST